MVRRCSIVMRSFLWSWFTTCSSGKSGITRKHAPWKEPGEANFWAALELETRDPPKSKSKGHEMIGKGKFRHSFNLSKELIGEG